MNYLFFVGSFYPAQEGGPDTSLFWLTEEIAKNNSVTVITFLKGISTKIKIFNIKNNKIIRLNNLKLFTVSIISFVFKSILFLDF